MRFTGAGEIKKTHGQPAVGTLAAPATERNAKISLDFSCVSRRESLDFPQMNGIQLKRRRKKLGITLDELSQYSGVSKSYLGRIEQGPQKQIVPSDEIAAKIESALERLEQRK